MKGLKTVSGIEYRAKTVYRIVYNVNKIQNSQSLLKEEEIIWGEGQGEGDK